MLGSLVWSRWSRRTGVFDSTGLVTEYAAGSHQNGSVDGRQWAVSEDEWTVAGVLRRNKVNGIQQREEVKGFLAARSGRKGLGDGNGEQ